MWFLVMVARVKPLLLLFLFAAEEARAQGALGTETLIQYLEKRDDLTKKERRRFTNEVKKKFGAAAIEQETEQKPEITVAKAILSYAIFARVDPKIAAKHAFEGYRGALGHVPPPIAIHYEILALEGKKPRGRPIDLAFRFPDYYNEEIAPELVAYWEEALAKGTIPDHALRETEEALDATRVLMRPLLLDKLRLLARLDRERAVASGVRKVEIQQDMAAIERELGRSFSRVARRPEVLDGKKRPYDRLRIQLEDMGLTLTDEDRYLDPESGPPPKKPVPKLPEPETPAVPEGEVPLVEPDAPPIPPVPDQARPGDPTPPKDPLPGRTLLELGAAYARRLRLLIEPWLGTPYRWGSDTRSGTDCSGFSRRLLREGFEVDLPRSSRDQFRVGHSVRIDDLRPGDLVFFDTRDLGQVTHVGVYAGDGRFAHASTTKGVVYDALESRYYRRAFRGARRILAYPR